MSNRSFLGWYQAAFERELRGHPTSVQVGEVSLVLLDHGFGTLVEALDQPHFFIRGYNFDVGAGNGTFVEGGAA